MTNEEAHTLIPGQYVKVIGHSLYHKGPHDCLGYQVGPNRMPSCAAFETGAIHLVDSTQDVTDYLGTGPATLVMVKAMRFDGCVCTACSNSAIHQNVPLYALEPNTVELYVPAEGESLLPTPLQDAVAPQDNG